MAIAWLAEADDRGCLCSPLSAHVKGLDIVAHDSCAKGGANAAPKLEPVIIDSFEWRICFTCSGADAKTARRQERALSL